MTWLLLVATLAATIPNAIGQTPGAQPHHVDVTGKLVAIRKDSVSLELNHKIQVVRVAPDAEIWRRGHDLNSLSQLVLGELVYAGYRDVKTAGEPTVEIMAEVPGGNGIWLYPHHIVEGSGCFGIAKSVSPTRVTVQSGHVRCVIHIDPKTEIWKGEIYRDTSVIEKGDEVSAAGTPDYVTGELLTNSVGVNVGITAGTVVSVNDDSFVVDQYPGTDPDSGYARGHLTVLMDSWTEFEDGTREDLKVGIKVRVNGLELRGGTLRATTVALNQE